VCDVSPDCGPALASLGLIATALEAKAMRTLDLIKLSVDGCGCLGSKSHALGFVRCHRDDLPMTDDHVELTTLMTAAQGTRVSARAIQQDQQH
jgi:hypothetical protein